MATRLECGGLPPLFNTAESESTASQRADPASFLKSGGKPPHSKDWPHAPIHRLGENGTYIVTAGTYRKEHFFRGRERLDYLEANLLRISKEFGWQLEAWAVFSNHYHFVAQGMPDAKSLRAALMRPQYDGTRSESSRRDSRSPSVAQLLGHSLTYEKSYLARLNYVHQNPAKHRLVAVANQYPWCSAAWFERTASAAQVRTIYSFKIDQLRIADDYEPV